MISLDGEEMTIQAQVEGYIRRGGYNVSIF